MGNFDGSISRIAEQCVQVTSEAGVRGAGIGDRRSDSEGSCFNEALGWADNKEAVMFLVRDIMYCKPGQARPIVQKFLALSKLGQRMGLGPMRVMTDVSAERYWTVVSEMEVKSLEEYAEMSRKSMENRDFQDAMKGYHDLIDHGRREIYMIETEVAGGRP